MLQTFREMRSRNALALASLIGHTPNALLCLLSLTSNIIRPILFTEYHSFLAHVFHKQHGAGPVTL